MTAERVVDVQLEAYNRRDLEAFVLTYSNEVIVRNLSDDTPILAGREQLSARYKKLFSESVGLHAVVTSRRVFGQFVVDEETVQGLLAHPEGLRVGVIYRVENGLISSVWFTR